MIVSTTDPILSAEERWLAQNRILLGVYWREYPLSNVERAVDQVRNGIQSVMFWGDSVPDIVAWKGGTMALISDPSKGVGVVEMCRAGATAPNGSGITAVGALFREYLMNPSWNQLFATPRNCVERKNSDGDIVPSGKTISLIYSRLKEVGYWGLAPWYVMPGEEVELLDLRIHTKKDAVQTRVAAGEPLYVRSADVERFVNDIVRDNYGIFPNTLNFESWDDGSLPIRFSIDSDTSERRAYMYSTICPDPNGKESLETILPVVEFAANGVCLAKLDLFDRRNLRIQEFLEDSGFAFASLFPMEGQLMGYWFKTKYPLAVPHYFQESQSGNPKIRMQSELVEYVLSRQGQQKWPGTKL